MAFQLLGWKRRLFGLGVGLLLSLSTGCSTPKSGPTLASGSRPMGPGNVAASPPSSPAFNNLANNQPGYITPGNSTTTYSPPPAVTRTIPNQQQAIVGQQQFGVQQPAYTGGNAASFRQSAPQMAQQNPSGQYQNPPPQQMPNVGYQQQQTPNVTYQQQQQVAPNVGYQQQQAPSVGQPQQQQQVPNVSYQPQQPQQQPAAMPDVVYPSQPQQLPIQQYHLAPRTQPIQQQQYLEGPALPVLPPQSEQGPSLSPPPHNLPVSAAPKIMLPDDPKNGAMMMRTSAMELEPLPLMDGKALSLRTMGNGPLMKASDVPTLPTEEVPSAPLSPTLRPTYQK